MKKNVIVTSILILSFISLKGESDIKNIISKAVSKIESAEGIYFKADFIGKGALAAYFGKTDFEVSAVPYFTDNFSGYKKAKLEGKQYNKGGEKPFKVIINNETVYSQDFANNILLRCPKYRGGDVLFNNLLIYYLEGLNDLKEAWKQEYELKSNIKWNNKVCHQLEYKSKTGYTFRFFIDEKDYTIHKIDATKDEFGGWNGGSMSIDIKEISFKKNKIKESVFNISQFGKLHQKEFSGNFPAINEKAPDWILDNYKGKQVSIKEYKGKVVLMDFWATWCRPCIKSIPQTEKLFQRYKEKGVEVLGITYKEKNDPIAFMKKKGTSYPILNGDPLEQTYNLKQSGLPIVYILDRDGNIMDFILGGAEIEKHLEKLIVKALNKK